MFIFPYIGCICKIQEYLKRYVKIQSIDIDMFVVKD